MRPLLLTAFALLGLSFGGLRVLQAKTQRSASAHISTPILSQPVRSLMLDTRDGSPAGASLMQFSPDGKTLATGGENCALQFWDVSSGRKRKLLDRSLSSTYAIEFSPDGRWLAIGTSQLVGATLWNTQTGRLVRTFKAPYPQSRGAHVHHIAFTPDGKSLIASTGGKYQVWDVVSGRLLHEIAPQERHYGLALSPDGKTLVGGFFLEKGKLGDQARVGIRFWNVRSGRAIRSVRVAGGWPLGFSPDGKQLLLRRTGTGAQETSRLGQYDLRSGAVWTRTQVKITANGDANPVAFSPNGRFLVVGHDDGRISILDGRTRQVAHPSNSGLPVLQRLRQGTTYILAVAYSPQGSLLATSSESGRVTLWRARS